MSYELKKRKGFTLVELSMVTAIGLVIALTVGILLYASNRNWARAYRYAYGSTQVNALETMVMFGSIGRKSNKSDYQLYVVDGYGNFNPAEGTGNEPEQVVTGNAVEFRYWDAPFGADILDTSITATAYALFYPQDGKLVVDTGPVVGGVKQGRTGTRVLVENLQNVEFSHTTKSLDWKGKGCVRMNLTIDDPDSERNLTVKTATLMRNVWP